MKEKKHNTISLVEEFPPYYITDQKALVISDPCDPRSRYDSLIYYYSNLVEIDWHLIKAQIIAESNMDPNAISKVNAKGLAQFMDKTFLEWWDGEPGITVERLPQYISAYDPEDSIKAQTTYMAWLLKQPHISTIFLALAAYNWGIGNVKNLLYEAMTYKDLVAELPPETQKYIKRIAEIYPAAFEDSKELLECL